MTHGYAHRLHGNGSSPYGPVKVFYADNPTSVLGCSSQYQVCVRNESDHQVCSSFEGIESLKSLPIPNLTVEQRNRLLWLYRVSFGKFSPHVAIRELGADSLVSRDTLHEGFQSALPVDQWQKDVQRWADIYLAYLQYASVDSAIGSTSPKMQQFYEAPSTEEGRYFCRNQVWKPFFCPRPVKIIVSRYN